MKAKTLMTAVMAGLLGLACIAGMASPAFSVEPGQYGPADQSGHGVFVNCNSNDQCAVFWFNHLSPDEQVWLMGVPNCDRGADQVCDVSLTRPSEPRWNGEPGAVDIGDSVGTLALTPMPDGTLAADWNVIALRPEACLGIGPGGLLLRDCIGPDIWHLIAGNAPSGGGLPPD